MTHDELFTLIALKLGKPRSIYTEVRGVGGKAGPLSRERRTLNYTQEFVSLAAAAGYSLTNSTEIINLHTKYWHWYAKNQLSTQLTHESFTKEKTPA